MKLYKKAAACLLTAAMALSMLTACGGGGGTPDTPDKPGSNTPSTLPNPNEIVLPDIGEGEGGGEGTETKPTKTPIIDVNNSKLAQYNKKYAGATECYAELQLDSYYNGALERTMQVRMARKNNDFYTGITTSTKNQKQQSSEILMLKNKSTWNQYLLIRNSNVIVKAGSFDDEDLSLDTGITTKLPDQMWSTKVKVGSTEHYAEIYHDGRNEFTLCFAENGDPLYLFVRDLNTKQLVSATLYKTVRVGSGTSKGLCELPSGFKTYTFNEDFTLSDAKGNKFTLIPVTDGNGTTTSYNILDKDGKDVTDDFKWVNDFYKMMSGQ